MNSSLEKLAKNLSDNDFKYLIEKCGSKHLEIFKKNCLFLWVYGQF